MGKCIFCKSETGKFTTCEHILPESLGGGDWAILPGGLLCNECQNRFGSSIEQQALADYPFSFFRVFLGIPTKKGKAPWFPSWEGTVKASLQPRLIDYEPSGSFRNAIEDGQKSQIRLLAHPLKPRMVCRFLVKMGIEVLAANDPQVVFNEEFDKARYFALLGKKHGDWWYLQHEDISAGSYYIKCGVTIQEWTQNVRLEVLTIEDGAEIFHLKLLFIDLFTPLEPRIKPPPKDSLYEPEYRLFSVG
jgi:hypothetical protein